MLLRSRVQEYDSKPMTMTKGVTLHQKVVVTNALLPLLYFRLLFYSPLPPPSFPLLHRLYEFSVLLQCHLLFSQSSSDLRLNKDSVSQPSRVSRPRPLQPHLFALTHITNCFAADQWTFNSSLSA